MVSLNTGEQAIRSIHAIFSVVFVDEHWRLALLVDALGGPVVRLAGDAGILCRRQAHT